MDDFHGVGGRYEVDETTRQRVRKDQPQKMPEGGGARDKEGRLLNTGAAPTQPAMPAPAKAAPWETPAANASGAPPAAEQSSSTTSPRSDRKGAA